MSSFTMRVVADWHKFLREVVDAPSLETVKARLDKAVSNLIQLNVSLLIAWGLAFKGSSQPKLFYDFMKTLSCLPGCEQRRHF